MVVLADGVKKVEEESPGRDRRFLLGGSRGLLRGLLPLVVSGHVPWLCPSG